jgi:hypothetical protein
VALHNQFSKLAKNHLDSLAISAIVGLSTKQEKMTKKYEKPEDFFGDPGLPDRIDSSIEGLRAILVNPFELVKDAVSLVRERPKLGAIASAGGLAVGTLLAGALEVHRHSHA